MHLTGSPFTRWVDTAGNPIGPSDGHERRGPQLSSPISAPTTCQRPNPMPCGSDRPDKEQARGPGQERRAYLI